MKKEQNNTVFVQVVEKPARKMIVKFAKKAKSYFEYCDEAGCDVWGVLCSVKEALYEPVGAWIPQNLRPKGTSFYSQGVEVPKNYKGTVPEGFKLIDLPACKMMVFQTEPYNDDDFCEVISNLSEVIDTYDPQTYGFEWADNDGPRFQLEPQGYRGYIEASPVKFITK